MTTDSLPGTTTEIEGGTLPQATGEVAPPPGADGESPQSLLDVTRQVLAGGESPTPEDKAGTPVAASPQEGQPAPDPNTSDATKTTTEEQPPFHTHPAWKRVIAERNEARTKFEEITRERDTLRPAADMHQATLDFMGRHGLTNDEVRQSFAIMAALRSDPAQAWTLLEPTVKNLRAFLGHELPDDLKGKVDSGQIDEDTARETARLRNAASFNGERLRETQTQQVDRTVREAALQTATAVDTWVAQQAPINPDHVHVNPLLEGAVRQKQAEWTNAGKRYDNPAAAVALVQEAYRGVQSQLARMRPARQPTLKVPSGSASTPAAGAPTTLLEAVRRAAAGI
jgi:hypothetical protein